MELVITPTKLYSAFVLGYWFTPQDLASHEELSLSRKAEWQSSRISVKRAYMKFSRTGQPLDILISADTIGRPLIANRPEYKISLAHTTTYTIGAVSDEYVGVDIEQMVPRNESLKRFIGDDSEFSLFENLSKEEQIYQMWLLKEALLKATGNGLSESMRKIKIIQKEKTGWMMDTKIHQIPRWQGIIISVSKDTLAAVVYPEYVDTVPRICRFKPSEL